MVNGTLHNRIDIVGPSGVGKTTIYNEVCRNWKKTSSWIHLDKLQLNEIANNSGTWFSKKKLKQHIKSLLNAPRKFNSGLGIRFIEDNQKLVSIIWNLLENNPVKIPYPFDFRIRTAHNVYKDFEKIQFIKEINDPRPCLIVEGLLHKSYLKNELKESGDTLQQYLSCCPLPIAVFILNTNSPDETVERKKNRSKRNAGETVYEEKDFRESVLSWQQLFMKMEKHLITSGVKVYHINASLPVKESAQNIIKLIELLKSTPSVSSHGKMVRTVI
jgi:ABC-type oligopeptide transport system ATPase subunit